MKHYKIFLAIALHFVLISTSSAQFKSLDFGLSIAPNLDDYRDMEYEYDFFSGGGIIQVPLGYTFSINKKMAFTPRVAYAYSLIRQSKGQPRLSQSPNPTQTILDSLIIIKNQTINFIKVGIAFSYWANQVGKGFYFESELQNVMLLSAKSHNTKQINGVNPQESIVDFKDEVRKNVPSLRVGAGYNLPIKRFSLFLRIGAEFRLSTYFKSTDNYTFLNQNIGFGFRYALQDKME